MTLTGLAHFSARYTGFLERRYPWVLAIGALLTLLGAISASRFELKTDFAELLPQDEPSIKDLNRAKDRMGGLSNLIVAIEGDDPDTNRRVVDDLVAGYQSLSDEYIVYLKYHLNDEKVFYEEHKYLYADLGDLEEIQRRLSTKIRYERIRNNPVLRMDFDGEQLEPVEFDITDIREKYTKKTSAYDKYLSGYLSAEDGHLFAILLYPPGTDTGVDFGKQLLQVVQRMTAKVCGGNASLSGTALGEEINRSCHDRYGQSVRIGWAGTIFTAIVEQKAIIDDLLLVTSICLLFVALVVVLYFRQLRVLPLIGLPLLMGTAWTFGISIFIVEHLNTSTAFLAAIIIGNGINFGLIQMARFFEERRAGQPLGPALQSALAYTAKATSIAALAASIAYGSLILTKFRGFNGFGYMGGLGMVLCWLSAFTIQPALLLLSERIRPARFAETRGLWKPGILFAPYSRFIARYGISLHGLGWLFAAGCIAVALPYLRDPYEYDFRNLRNQSEGVEGYELGTRVGRIFPRRLNPLFVLADRSDQVPLIVTELNRTNSSGPFQDLFQEIRSIHSYLPAAQNEKIRILKKIRRLLTKSTLSWLSDEDRAEIEQYIPPERLAPITVDQLPPAMTRLYTEKNGRIGLPIAIYPRHGRTTWDGHFLIELAEASRTIYLPDGDVVTSAGSATIFADMIRAIERDGPRAVVASLLGVMLLIILAYRSLKLILLVLVTLLFGVVWTIGPVAMIDLKLNFLNFIGLPITFGIGIDYAVNVLNRYRIEGPGSIDRCIASTGGAVALCSLTTLIGYSSLLIADNNALVSFGLLAVIGEIASLSAAILLLPAIILTLERRKQRREAQRSRMNSDKRQ